MLGQPDSVHPLRDFQLPKLFQEGGQCSDRLLLVHCLFPVTPGIMQPPRCQPGERRGL